MRVDRQVLLPANNLFEQPGGGSAGGFLPCPEAEEEALEAVGVAFCKSIIDDHPIGAWCMCM